MGGVYALIAAGLSLIWGVMEVINFAHGEFLMISMFMTFFFVMSSKLDPLIFIPLCAVILFLLGIVVFQLVVKHVLKGPMVSQIFSTYGVSLFLASLALFLWGHDYKSILPEYVHLKGTLEMFGIVFNVPRLVATLGCMITYGILFLFLAYTKTGKALRAVSQDKEAASLLGVNANLIYALSWGIAAACVGIAGTFLSTFFYIFPFIGAPFVTLTFVIVVLGGFGSLMGSLVGGFIVGAIHGVTGVMFPGYGLVFIYLIFFLILLFRPKGLFGY